MRGASALTCSRPVRASAPQASALEAALATRRVVRTSRDAYDSGYTDGLVIALTDEWVAMHVLADRVHLDGIEVMRVRDISSVLDGHSDLVVRAFDELNPSVATFDLPSRATTRDLLLIAAERHPLTAFTVDDDGEETLLIGRLVKAGKKRVRLRFVRNDCVWLADVGR